MCANARARLRARGLTGSALAALVALLSIPTSGQASTGQCPHADSRPGQASAADYARATLCLVNERRGAGLRRLERSEPLARTAQRYAETMIATRRFGHL